jgi:hypothetical protein
VSYQQEQTMRVYHLRDRQWGVVFWSRDPNVSKRIVRWSDGFYQTYIPSRLIRVYPD